MFLSLGLADVLGHPASSTSTLLDDQSNLNSNAPEERHMSVPVPPTARVTPACLYRQPNAYILSVTILVAFLHTRHHVSFRACALILLVLNLLLRAVPGEILGKEKLPGSLQTVFSPFEHLRSVQDLSFKCQLKEGPPPARQKPGSTASQTPPSKPNPPKPNTRTAASTASLLLNKTRDELLNPSDIPWDSIDTARRFIPAENGRSISLPYLEDIAMILLRIGADASSVVTKNACRAVAMLLERWKRDEIIEDLADDVKKLLEHFSSVREDLETAAEMLARTVEQQRAEMSTLTARVEEDLSQLIQQAAADIPAPATPPAPTSPPSSDTPRPNRPTPRPNTRTFLDPDDPTTWVTHDDVSSEFATRRGPPTWQSAQAMRQPRGPGPAPEIAAHHKANFTRQHRRPATQETRVDNIATTTDDDKVTDTAANDDNASATTEIFAGRKSLSHRVNRGKINMEVTLSDLHADPPPAELDADTLSQRALSDDADERDIMDGPGLELPQGVDDHHVI
ncbi:hypothetical protein R3P38DRAFT_2811582 [Favolaschia claudopus]|uniref:Uncharacterized protein n=1 Tax=Favolaschia claudopus TaxID=2862362 RepID=A0AAV9Z8L6_9AGAR